MPVICNKTVAWCFAPVFAITSPGQVDRDSASVRGLSPNAVFCLSTIQSPPRWDKEFILAQDYRRVVGELGVTNARFWNSYPGSFHRMPFNPRLNWR